MPNLLAHALFAGAAYSALWYTLGGVPITEYAAFSAFFALLPDLDLDDGEGRSPYGHSLGYGALYVLLLVSGLTLALAFGVIERPLLFPLGLGAVLGLGTHLLLDSLVEPGIFSFPREGTWGQFSLWGRRTRMRRIDGWVSFLSLVLLLALLALH